MTDREKILLCQAMLRDFWEFSNKENQIEYGKALQTLNGIGTVLDFDEKTRGGQGNE